MTCTTVSNVQLLSGEINFGECCGCKKKTKKKRNNAELIQFLRRHLNALFYFINLIFEHLMNLLKHGSVRYNWHDANYINYAYIYVNFSNKSK